MVFLVLIHIPVLWERVLHWEKVQMISLGLGLLAVGVTIQAYASTKLQPEQVLVWMPLTLPLDAGAMLQLVILILKEDSWRGPDGLQAALLSSLSWRKNAPDRQEI
jgi:hypothetical protein